MKYNNVFTKPEDIRNIREATKISSIILKKLRDSVKIGVNAEDINQLAEEECKKNNVIPAFKGVPGPAIPFPKAVCVAVNDEILHGLPNSSTIFKSGDIVKIDFGIIYNGFYTDHCVTVGLGVLTDEENRLINTAKLCVDEAAKEAIVGNYTGDISYVLENITNLAGFNFVTSYCGHGIGKSLHESPEVLSWGDRNTGDKLVKGMLLCVENQVTIGSGNLRLQNDGWTLKTKDGSKGAMFEHMVLVSEDSPEILTILD